MSDVDKNETTAKDNLLQKIYRSKEGVRERLNWEPLQVLISAIENNSINDIGGPPQLIKIYKHANTLPINVLWPEESLICGHKIKNYEITHLGRPLLGYERTRLLTLDPLMWDFIEPWNIREHAAFYNNCEEKRLRSELLKELVVRLAWRRDNLALQEKLSLMMNAGCTFDQLRAEMERASPRN